MSANVFFIGLGNMGMPMALNLVRAGFPVNGYDLLPENMQAFVAGGGHAVLNLTAAAAVADLVITMLPASRHVENIYLGVEGILTHVRTSTLLIDCSTIAPEVARKVADAARGNGLTMLDAPVSGGTGGATTGTLTFMVGGPVEGLAAARPYLEKMGKAIFHAGDHGSGQTVKICNNMLLGILMAGTSEAIKLGVANGMNPQVLSEIMAKSSGRNWVLDVYNPCPGVSENVPAAKGYAGGFGVDLMRKDLGLAVDSATATNSHVPLGALVRDLYDKHGASGYGDLDFSSIYVMDE